ncbi:hypothetical protein GCM10020221_22070 [Streptomyces thioluteus]|uniref:Uncharacterized protein n=1 Tax=Streptomyces thioluteus TaxID=66431 RepID=A0ABN3WTR9_STRTU
MLPASPTVRLHYRRAPRHIAIRSHHGRFAADRYRKTVPPGTVLPATDPCRPGDGIPPMTPVSDWATGETLMPPGPPTRPGPPGRVFPRPEGSNGRGGNGGSGGTGFVPL